MADGNPLLDVAAAVADGVAIDWASAERSAMTDADRGLLSELHFIADVAHIPAALASSGDTPTLRTPPASDAAFSQWGPLGIIEQVGRGTFGDVYRAWDSRLDREVALKILRRRERDDETHASTVVQEGRLLARVSHPNVVTVYGAERVDGQVGIWMEFVEGKTLEEELRDQGRFEMDQAVTVGIELCSALSAVHRAGLVHRDVKAHNLMRDRDGRLKLTDFGTGCELEEPADGEPRELAGTPLYLPPELLEHKIAAPQSDIYSVGVLLYHLVTGTYPVCGRSLKDLREAHARGARTTLRDARPDLPAAFVDIVDRALDPDPQKRYKNPAALGAALTSVVESERASTSAAAPTTLRRVRTWTKPAALGALLLLGVLGVPRLWRSVESPVIAVLPFKNLSEEASSEYFVDGLTDEIIRNLSVIDGLAVRSRTSSFAFKGKQRDVGQVGEQLRANLIVEGSVLRSDGRLRVNVQLVRVADDTPLWSGRFDRKLEDIFVIQDEISRSIVNELRLKLGRGQRRYDTNLEAYEIYLKARALVDPHGSVALLRQAAKLFEQVIARDPAFAPAQAGLADAWAMMSVNSVGVQAEEAYARMRPAAEKAIHLDPLLAEAHAAMGVVLARDGDWAKSEAAFHRAIELNRNLASIYTSFAISALFPQGKVEDALGQLDVALRADAVPLDVRRNMAWVQVSAGRYDDAIGNCRGVLIADPDDGHTRQVLARALFHKGQVGEAIALLEKLGPGSSGFLGYAYAIVGRRAEAEKLAAENANVPARLALIYAGLKDKDRTLEALERMAAGNDPRVGMYLTYPEVAFLRGDPRLAAFRKKLRLSGA